MQTNVAVLRALAASVESVIPNVRPLHGGEVVSGMAELLKEVTEHFGRSMPGLELKVVELNDAMVVAMSIQKSQFPRHAAERLTVTLNGLGALFMDIAEVFKILAPTPDKMVPSNEITDFVTSTAQTIREVADKLGSVTPDVPAEQLLAALDPAHMTRQ